MEQVQAAVYPVDNPPLTEIDPNDPALLQDPYAYFARLRAEAPVFRDPASGIIFVSTYDLVLEVNKKPKLFSSDVALMLKSGGQGGFDPEEKAIMDQGLPWIDTMLTADPPKHSRYKRLALKAFTPMRVEALHDYIVEVVDGLIDRFAGRGAVELKAEFADQLPAIVTADLLGVPRSDIPQFRIWLAAALARLAGGADRATRIDAARKEIELQRYFVDQFARRRAQPSDDVLSDLVHATLAEEGDPRPLDDAELMGMTHQIFVAGQETTAHALTYAVYQYARNPEVRAALAADPALVSNLIEESLRHLSPVNNSWRVAATDVELGGVPIKAGEVIYLRWGAANRDEAKFEDPDRFDIHRKNAREHMAFGAGIHTCLGMALARKEMAIALPRLFARLPNLRLKPGHEAFRVKPSPLLRGAAELRLEFDPA